MRFLSILLALLLLCGGVLAETTPSDFSDHGIVQSNLGQVNLREKPSAQSARVHLLQNYDMARILGTEKGDDGKLWYHVDFEGQEGYIHGDYFIVLTVQELALRQDTKDGQNENDAAAYTLPANAIVPAYPVPRYVSQLLFIAEKELGYKEETNGVTKYGIWSGDSKAEWCAEYLCWCTYQTDRQFSTQLFNKIYPNYSGNNTGRDWFLKEGRYVARKGIVPGWGSQWFKGESAVMQANAYVPQPGDWLFISTSSTGDTVHVAMVTHCTTDESGNVQVHVLEGNNPDKVQRNTYALDYWGILGYGTVHDVADITLKEGHKGRKVEALQQKLCQAGYFKSENVTGTYGSITLEAVKTFQRARGLQATGMATPETQWMLDAFLASQQSQSP